MPPKKQEVKMLTMEVFVDVCVLSWTSVGDKMQIVCNLMIDIMDKNQKSKI